MNSQIRFDILPVLNVMLMPFFSFSLCSLSSSVHLCTCRLEPANDNSVILLLLEQSIAVWVVSGVNSAKVQMPPIWFLIQSLKPLIYSTIITARTWLNVSFVLEVSLLKFRNSITSGDRRSMLILGVNDDLSHQIT